MENIIPSEVAYLRKYDVFKRFLEDDYEMPDTMVALLTRFLEQNHGKLSKRARDKEFTELTASEIEKIETSFSDIFD